ncbi:MAG: GldG family protein [Pseudomonadota bacterium]|nr:GldG family protein [Pseudomonadota bacterium]
MTARKNLLANSWLQLVLVMIVVVLANLWSSDHFARLDVTQDRLHSLDESSKRLVASLDRPIVVKAWISKGLSAPYNNHEQIIRDKLDELQAYSGGRMKITIVDPGTDAELLAEAQKYGLTPLEQKVTESNRAELRRIWLGAVLLYGDKQEVLPSLTDLSALEYDFASAISRLKQKPKDAPVLAWTMGNGEPDLVKPDGPLREMMEQLARKFVLQPLALGGPGAIPKEVDALLVIGPQKPLSDRAIYQIDQFLMRGGAAAIFVTHTRPDLRTYRATRTSSGLEPLLGHYGIQANRDIVMDRVQNGVMRFPVRVGNRQSTREVNYALIPQATDLSRRNVLVSGLDGMLFPFTSSIQVAESLNPGVEAEVLARTSASSGSVQDLKTVDPTQLTGVLSSEKRGPFAVLVTLTGPLRSFFETRPTPPPDPDAPLMTEDESPEEPPMVIEGAPTRLVVGGSADFVANNLAFMLNLADWLVQDESLIGIRSKTATLPTLTATTPREQLGWKGFNLLAGPLALLAFGAARQVWFRRRARRSGVQG